MLDQTLFVIVLYRQRLNECQAFRSIEPLRLKYPSRISLFVYDNSPQPLIDISATTGYHHDQTNSGVSRAYNVAFKFAREKGFRFLLLMDQDTFFPEQVFESYSHAVARFPKQHVFAPTAIDKQEKYSPFRLVLGRGTPVKEIKAGIFSLRDRKVINSGLLVSITAFEMCGGYDERFPLDFSDIVFCDRLASKDLSFCLIDGQIQHHHSSKATDKSRFENYLQALALYKKVGQKNVSYWWGGFPRAAKLSVQLRDRWFLRKFFSHRA